MREGEPDPADPTESTDPADPADPTESTDPTESADPTESTDPADPADPADPTESTDPADPTESTDPADPTESTDPADPADPTESTDPAPGAFAATARSVRQAADALQALLNDIHTSLENRDAIHTQHLHNDTAAQLRDRSEYRMYVMAGDAMHFRQRLARAEADGLGARLRRVLNRIYGDCYQIYRLLLAPQPRFPAYAATEPDKVYPLGAVEEMVREMHRGAAGGGGAQQQQRPPPAATPLERCLVHSRDHLRSYNALLRQTGHDLMLMHAREVDHLHRQARALAQLLDITG